MGSLLDKMVSSIAQVFWTVNVLSQAIAAGFAFSYVVVFGSFLQWTIRRRNWEFFTEQYAPFRRKLKVRRTYFAFLPVGPLLVAVLSLIANRGRHALLPHPPGLRSSRSRSIRGILSTTSARSPHISDGTCRSTSFWAPSTLRSPPRCSSHRKASAAGP